MGKDGRFGIPPARDERPSFARLTDRHHPDALWSWFLGGIAVAGVAYFVVPGDLAKALVFVLIRASVVLVILAAVRMFRPERSFPWVLLAVGVTLSVGGSSLRYLVSIVQHTPPPYPSISDALFLLSHALFAIALVSLVRMRTGGADRAGRIDGLIFAVGLGVLSWALIVDPSVRETGVSLTEHIVLIAYPVMDLIMLVAAVRLAIAPGRLSPARCLLLGAFVAQFLNISISVVQRAEGTLAFGSATFAISILSFGLLGAAALHPSMRGVSDRVGNFDRNPSRRRFLLLTISALMVPVGLVVQNVIDTHVEAPLFAAASAVLLVLVLSRMRGISTDLADLRATQRALHKAESRYRALVENIPAVTYIEELDPTAPTGSRVVYVSPQVRFMLGRPPEDFVVDRQLMPSFIHPEDRHRVDEEDSRTNRTREPFRVEHRMLVDGTVLWVQNEAVFVEHRGAEPGFWQGIIVDITARKMAEEELALLNQRLEGRVIERTEELESANRELMAATEEAERASQAKSEFLSRISHELRTPLNAILGFGQLLETADLRPEDGESVHHIMKGGRHLLDLINEVLDISRIDSRELSLSIEPVSAEEVVRETTDLILPLAAERSIELEATPGEGPLMFLADRQRLKQVVLNLLSNAVKYNRDGGRVTVRVLRSSESSGLIEVEDTGAGIAPDDMPRLFKPFDRLGAESGDVEGSGLGLALTDALVQAMKGRLEATSELGRGSTFSVELPLAREAGAGDGGARMDVDAASPRTVLYIEDNLANLKLVERILLLRPGLRLIAAMQGRLGVELARDHRPDVVLLDLDLPDIPGEEALKQLRDLHLGNGLPVVVTSAGDGLRNRSRLERLGATALVAKPIDAQALLDAVDAALGVSARREAG
jgi:PAS domain S-box-containing protein